MTLSMSLYVVARQGQHMLGSDIGVCVEGDCEWSYGFHGLVAPITNHPRREQGLENHRLDQNIVFLDNRTMDSVPSEVVRVGIN